MPLIAKQDRATAKRGHSGWLVGAGVLLALMLLLPPGLLLLPRGIRAGRHGVSATFGRTGRAAPGMWTMALRRPTYQIYLVGWKSTAYQLVAW
jgi:hypothetical protein